MYPSYSLLRLPFCLLFPAPSSPHSFHFFPVFYDCSAYMLLSLSLSSTSLTLILLFLPFFFWKSIPHALESPLPFILLSYSARVFFISLWLMRSALHIPSLFRIQHVLHSEEIILRWNVIFYSDHCFNKCIFLFWYYDICFSVWIFMSQYFVEFYAHRMNVWLFTWFSVLSLSKDFLSCISIRKKLISKKWECIFEHLNFICL